MESLGKSGKKLTLKERIFIAEYSRDFNATRAALAAGYSPNRPDRAGEIGYQLLQKTPIREALERATDLRLKELGVQTESILRDRVKVAKADVRSLFRPDGTLKQPEEWPDDIAGAIAGFEVIETFEGTGENRKWSGYLKKVRLNDRNPAQHDLMDHAELFPERSAKPGLEVHGDVNLTNIELSARAIYLIKLALERKKAAEEQGQTGGRGTEKP